MKKFAFSIAVLAALACATAALGYGSLVSSFKAPSALPVGIGYAIGMPSGFWVSCAGNNYRYRMTTTGSIYASFPNPAPGSFGCGAANIGGTGYVFIVSNTASLVYCIDMDSGSIYSSYRSPGRGTPMGIDYCGTGGSYLYCTELEILSKLYFMEAHTGSIYWSWPLVFLTPADVAYDPRGYLWISDPFGKLVWQCNTKGEYISTFSVSAYGGVPGGCGCDGTYVYVGICAPVNSVLKFETDPAVGVAPKSLGKIKALFR